MVHFGKIGRVVTRPASRARLTNPLARPDLRRGREEALDAARARSSPPRWPRCSGGALRRPRECAAALPSGPPARSRRTLIPADRKDPREGQGGAVGRSRTRGTLLCAKINYRVRLPFATSHTLSGGSTHPATVPEAVRNRDSKRQARSTQLSPLGGGTWWPRGIQRRAGHAEVALRRPRRLLFVP